MVQFIDIVKYKRKKPSRSYRLRKFKKKPKINFRLKAVLRKKNPDRRRYYTFFLKRKNNIFITITNVKGQVIASQSAGSCKIKTKKKKKSWDTLKTVAESVSKIARLKNIRYIHKFFMTSTYMKNAKIIFRGFKKSGVRILQNVIVRAKTHGLPMRKKKLKRL